MWQFLYKVIFVLNPFYDIHRQNKDGSSLLMRACRENNLPLVNVLIKAGADLNVATLSNITPLFCAIFNGFTDVAIALIKAGANTEKGTGFGLTPLMLATQDGHTEIVKALIEAKANIHALDILKNSALAYAIRNEHTQIALALIDAHCPINNINLLGDRPIHLAILSENNAIIDGLLLARASVNVQDVHGRTPLNYAVSKGNYPLAIKLIQWMSDTNEIDYTTAKAFKSKISAIQKRAESNYRANIVHQTKSHRARNNATKKQHITVHQSLSTQRLKG